MLDLERKAGGGQNMKQYSKLLYHKWLTGRLIFQIISIYLYQLLNVESEF